nr:5'-nucleotidase C-terminal domain-containing protein [Lachnospiraceae bacterium]
GDFCVDAYRAQMGSDVAIANSGGIRDNIPKGEITYASLMKVNPFGNMLGMIEVTGQQIVDALEWGARAYPEESGSFLQVSGLTYEIDPSIPDPCKKNSEDAFVGIEGERRVKNVKVGDEPIDLKKTYTLAGVEFMLFENGDGYTMFDGAKVLQQGSILDIQALINYMLAQPNETVGEEYADPYGNGRITILEK